eukprot:3902069-Pyramimonas_sp.AAC.1
MGAPVLRGAPGGLQVAAVPRAGCRGGGGRGRASVSSFADFWRLALERGWWPIFALRPRGRPWWSFV